MRLLRTLRNLLQNRLENQVALIPSVVPEVLALPIVLTDDVINTAESRFHQRRKSLQPSWCGYRPPRTRVNCDECSDDRNTHDFLTGVLRGGLPEVLKVV